MFRKALLALSATGMLAGVLAAPAAAVNGCQLHLGTTTHAEVCVDMDGDLRLAYVRARSVVQPTELKVWDTRVEMCVIGEFGFCDILGKDKKDYVIMTGEPTVNHRGPKYLGTTGHSIRACASITVNGEYYHEICSQRVNM